MSAPSSVLMIRFFAIVVSLSMPELAGCSGAAETRAVPFAPSGSEQTPAGRPSTTLGRAHATETVLYSFGSGGSNDGRSPRSTLRYIRGALYGTTYLGGANGLGTVFSVTTSGSESVVHSFGSGSDGQLPLAGLTNSGYGMTPFGGAYGYGAVYRILPSGRETQLYSFGSGSDGQNPFGALIEFNGLLYGTTRYGGANGAGTVFSITPSGTEKVLYSFAGGSDGKNPSSVLTTLNGTLYGTTESGGTNNHGTVFSITTSGSESVLYSFTGGDDGAAPLGGLINVGGALYGTTSQGGTMNHHGTIFKVTRTGTETVLHRFGGTPDGSKPHDGRLILVNGVLYGTTRFGGAHDTGAVYSIKPNGSSEAVVHSFDSVQSSDGRYPYAGVIDVDGLLYGTTSKGGTSDHGTVFALTP